MALLDTLKRWLGPPDVRAEMDEAAMKALQTHVTVLYQELRELRAELHGVKGTLVQLQTDEARRAAEHSAMVDTLARLYKRVSARIARESGGLSDKPEEESPLDFRRRLGR